MPPCRWLRQGDHEFLRCCMARTCLTKEATRSSHRLWMSGSAVGLGDGIKALFSKCLFLWRLSSQHEIDGRLLSARSSRSLKKGSAEDPGSTGTRRLATWGLHSIYVKKENLKVQSWVQNRIGVLFSRDLGWHKCLCLFPVSYACLGWYIWYDLIASHWIYWHLGSRHEALGTHSKTGNLDWSSSAVRSHGDSWQCIHVGWVLHINWCL